MASCLRPLRPVHKQLKVLLAPLLLAFIPICWPRKEAYAAYVVAIMAYYWVSQVLPIAVTAMIPILAYPLFGVTSARHISTVYFSDSNVLFFGSMVLAVAVEISNFHERVALKILLVTGPNPRRLLLGFMSATSVLSFFISNTATTALMVPIVVAVIKELETCRMGDQVESPEVVDEADCGAESEGLNLRGVPQDRVNIYKGLLLSTCFTASASGTIMLTATGANIVLSGFMDQKYGSAQPITYFSWLLYSLPISGLLVLLLYLWLVVLFIGFKSFDTSQNHVVMNLLRKKYAVLGPMRYVEKNLCVIFVLIVVLWLFRNPKVVPGWGDFFTSGYVSDGTVAMLITLLLFLLPAENPLTFKGAGSVPTIMNWKAMQEKFAWSTFLLLGGGYGIAAGVEQSGLSKLISRHLAEFNHLPDWAFLMVSCLMVTFLTEFSSNVTTASIFVPMMDSLAQARRNNPLFFILPTTLSCSYSFMFPAATPPNAIVFGLKVMSLLDMAKAGVVLNLFGFILTQSLTLTYGTWLFDLDHMPNWAINSTASLFRP